MIISSINNVKVATTLFSTQPDDICINKVGTEAKPLRIIKFQNYLQKWNINIPTNGEWPPWNGTCWCWLQKRKQHPDMGCSYGSWHRTSSTNGLRQGCINKIIIWKSTEHMNRILKHQHDVRQHEKEKKSTRNTSMVLCNLITTNIEKSFVSEQNNIITGFYIVNNIALMDYIWTNYGTVPPKQLQENEIVLDAQCSS